MLDFFGKCGCVLMCLHNITPAIQTLWQLTVAFRHLTSSNFIVQLALVSLLNCIRKSIALSKIWTELGTIAKFLELYAMTYWLQYPLPPQNDKS